MPGLQFLDPCNRISRAFKAGRVGKDRRHCNAGWRGKLFYHPEKKAVLTCNYCGRFLCALCDVDFAGQHLCPPCIESGKKKKKIKNLENHRVLYDDVALAVAVLPLMLCYFVVLTAPISLFIAFRYWNAPRQYHPPYEGAVCPCDHCGLHRNRWDQRIGLLPDNEGLGLMASEREYYRLPGRSVGFSRRSLWIGSDHLLSITNRGYSEDYKRFYYRDIRALLVRKTLAYVAGNSILGALAGIFVLLHVLGFTVWNWEEAPHIGVGFWTALFLIFFLTHLLRGPTCAVSLYTAVHAEPLPSLSRIRVARKAIAILRARVEAVQGVLSPDQAFPGASFQELNPAPVWMPAAERQPEKLEEYSGNFHASLFAVLLFNAVLTFVACFIRNVPINIVNVLVGAALVISLIGALIRQRKSHMGGALKKITWTSGIYIWLVSVLNSLIAMYLLFQGGVQPGQYGYWDFMKSVLEAVPSDHLPILILQLIVAASSLALGIAGFVLLQQFRRGLK